MMMSGAQNNQEGHYGDYQIMTIMSGDEHKHQTQLVPQTTSSLLDSSSSMMNSRFWFDMYQRLKTEMAKERRDFVDAQA